MLVLVVSSTSTPCSAACVRSNMASSRTRLKLGMASETSCGCVSSIFFLDEILVAMISTGVESAFVSKVGVTAGWAIDLTSLYRLTFLLDFFLKLRRGEHDGVVGCNRHPHG